MERVIGYRFPELNSVKDEDFFYHAAKLAEECGEVCQTICKRQNLQLTVDECLDVLYCAEAILRKCGITDSCLDALVEDHVKKQKARGYVRVEGTLV